LSASSAAQALVDERVARWESSTSGKAFVRQQAERSRRLNSGSSQESEDGSDN
jgi:hypothetical protein